MANDNRSFRERLTKALHIIPGGSLLFALIPLVVFGYWGWYHYAAKRIDRTIYGLKLEHIEISTQPEWIKSSVLEEVFKTKKLDRINALEPSANADIASAFETHPWVKSASRVRKFGNNIMVDLVYRQPLAMINVPYRDNNSGKWSGRLHFYPVDQYGVVLPLADFSEDQVPQFILVDIENIDCIPEGMAYSDIRVQHALKLAAYLEGAGKRKLLGIQWVNVRRDNDVSSGKPWLLQLQTEDKQMIVWGHAPGDEVPGESSADRKIADLTNWLKVEREKGSQGGQIDLPTGKSIPGQTASSR
ncbi:MAG: hypothetical protein U0930_05985 [Pirellulales bacterium]